VHAWVVVTVEARSLGAVPDVLAELVFGGGWGGDADGQENCGGRDGRGTDREGHGHGSTPSGECWACFATGGVAAFRALAIARSVAWSTRAASAIDTIRTSPLPATLRPVVGEGGEAKASLSAPTATTDVTTSAQNARRALLAEGDACV
jgi:hypothetical protein